MPLRLTRMSISDRIVEPGGTPNQQFLRWFNKILEQVENAINGLADAVARLTTAEGDINTLETSKADAGAITGGDLTMATGRVLGRTTASTGAIEELTLTQVLDLIGSAAQGDILYRGASSWARLGAGTSGEFLKTLGTGANPAWAAPTESFIIACSDEATSIPIATAKITFRMPYAFTVTAVRASLTTAQTSGSIFTVDINEAGATILSTKLTIDNGEKTSTTAATAPVISDSSLADDAEISVDVDQIGDGTAKGLKVVLIGHRT